MGFRLAASVLLLLTSLLPAPGTAQEPVISEAQIQQRMKKLGYSEGVAKRLLSSAWFRREVIAELTAHPARSVRKSILRPITIYRGVEIWPSKYNPGTRGWMSDRDNGIWMSKSLGEAAHYGTRWKFPANDGTHTHYGLIFEYQIPRFYFGDGGNYTPGFLDRELMHRIGDETPFVNKVGSYRLSDAILGRNVLPAHWYDFDDIWDGKKIDESAMTSEVEHGLVKRIGRCLLKQVTNQLSHIKDTIEFGL